MTIEIKPETERLVKKEIGSGHFRSVDELIVEGLHAWLEKQGLAPRGHEPQTERLRQEVDQLAGQWRRDTLHLSLVCKKVSHPAYFRIMGMGESVVPLLLEALRHRP